jgi:hypothetical protein
MPRRVRLTKRRGIVLIFLSGLLLFGIIDSRFLWTGWSPDTGGLCFMSQRYDANGNSSYSTVFFGVNFTFLYWTYPPPVAGPNGTTIAVVDAPYRAYFAVAFEDGSKETLSLFVDGYTALVPLQFPHGARTVHSYPSAGIVTSESWGLWGGWQFTVAIVG